MRLAAALFALVPCAALAAPSKVVAVLELRDKLPRDGERLDVAYLADAVRSAAKEAAPGARIITRENMLVLLQTTGKKLEDCEGECEVETGRRVGADLVISGEVLRFGSQLKANLKLHETRSGELLSGAVASGSSADELDRNVAPAVRKLFAAVEGRGRDVRAEEGPPSPGWTPVYAFSAHAGFGYGSIERTSNVAYGGGATIELRPSPSVGLGFFAEATHIVAEPGGTSVLLVGPALRYRLPAVSFEVGGGYARATASSGDLGGGYGALAAADVVLRAPFVLHAQASWRSVSQQLLTPALGGATSRMIDLFSVEGGLGVLF